MDGRNRRSIASSAPHPRPQDAAYWTQFFDSYFPDGGRIVFPPQDLEETAQVRAFPYIIVMGVAKNYTVLIQYPDEFLQRNQQYEIADIAVLANNAERTVARMTLTNGQQLLIHDAVSAEEKAANVAIQEANGWRKTA